MGWGRLLAEISIRAPGTTPPDGSLTVPDIVSALAWDAKNAQAMTRKTARAITTVSLDENARRDEFRLQHRRNRAHTLTCNATLNVGTSHYGSCALLYYIWSALDRKSVV